MPNDDIRDITADLQRVKPVPAALLVYCDGVAEPKRVAVPNVRKRWSRLSTVLDQLPWLVIEAIDKAGGVLATWRRDDDDGAPPPVVGGLTIREREIGELVLSAFKQSHGMFLGMFGSLLQATKAQMEQMGAAGRQLTSSYERLMVVQRQTLELQQGSGREGEGDDDGGGGLADVVRALVTRELAGKAPAAAPAAAPVKNGNPPPRPKSTKA